MSHSRKMVVLALAGFISFSFSTSAFAAEGNSLTGFFKKLFHIPAKTTEQAAGVTANTLQNTGEKVVAATGENTAQIVQGDLPKVGELVTDPIVGSAETVGQTVAETASIPANVAETMPTDAQPATA